MEGCLPCPIVAVWAVWGVGALYLEEDIVKGEMSCSELDKDACLVLPQLICVSAQFFEPFLTFIFPNWQARFPQSLRFST